MSPKIPKIIIIIRRISVLTWNVVVTAQSEQRFHRKDIEIGIENHNGTGRQDMLVLVHLEQDNQFGISAGKTLSA